MTEEEITNKIQAVLPDAKVSISGSDCNFFIEVVSKVFAEKTPLKCHRMINDIFKQQLDDGTLHAISIKTRAE